jgi:chromatin segregation and condensation protein Rec8/ScpA/Scc1 (kleisin family)
MVLATEKEAKILIFAARDSSSATTSQYYAYDVFSPLLLLMKNQIIRAANEENMAEA